MMKFFRLSLVALLSMQCGFMKAADDALSEQEHLLDVVLCNAPSLLLDYVSVCALSSVSKKIENRVTAKKDVRRSALEDAIVKKGYSIFQDGYNSEKKKYDPDKRALYFYAQSSLAVAIMAYNEKCFGYFKNYDFGCIYAYASDGDIKVVMVPTMIMSAGTSIGIRMGCCRGIPYLHMGFSDMGQVIDGPFVSLSENNKTSITLIYRRTPCEEDGELLTYPMDGKERTRNISGVEKYIKDRRRVIDDQKVPTDNKKASTIDIHLCSIL
jgi:hypothetical protein